jgi:transmembrane sensor
MTRDPDWHLIERYLAGDCTADEAATVRQWLSADSAAREYIEAVQRAMDLDAPSPLDWGSDRAWRRIADTVGLPPERAAEPEERTRVTASDGRARIRAWLGAAAAVVLAIGGVGLLDRLAHRTQATAHVAMRQYATSRGQRLDTRLPDGTRVMLAPASRLGVPVDYARSARTVELDGEAYFDVVHDSLRPFTVRARYALARDLGTRFGVRARAGEPLVRVAVADGKVALSAPALSAQTPAVLARGDLGSLDTLGVPSVSTGANIDRYLAWTRGKLIFDRTPLDQVAVDIARWYNVDVSLAASSLNAKRLTIAFDDEPLEHVLDAVSFALDLRYERVGDHVTFYPTRSAK